MVTAFGDVDSAVEAMKLGAADYLNKPVNPEELLLLVAKCLESRRKDQTISELQTRLDERLGFERIIGRSQAMLTVFEQARRAAMTEITVLVTGESGTGKELIAEAIHQNSLRRDGPFVTVNMAAVPSHLAESELFGHVKGAFTGATESRSGDSKPPTTERSSSTKSATSRGNPRRNCCASWRTGRSRRSAATTTARSTCASWRRPAEICRRWSPTGNSARICTTG
jgi:hypothetical protein